MISAVLGSSDVSTTFILCWLNRRRDARKPVLLRWDFDLLSSSALFAGSGPVLSTGEGLSELTRRCARGRVGTLTRLFRSYCSKPTRPFVFACVLIVCLLTWRLVSLRLGRLMKCFGGECDLGVLIAKFNDGKVSLRPWWSSLFRFGWYADVTDKSKAFFRYGWTIVWRLFAQ